MAQPDSQFNLAMGGSAGVVESAATLADAGADYGNSTGGVNCTGPFELTEWKAGESITLTRYDDYWDESLRAHAGEVKFLFMGDATARVNALNSGEVDGGWMIPAEAYSQLGDSGKRRPAVRSDDRRVEHHHQRHGRTARRPAGPPGAADGTRPRGHRRCRREGGRPTSRMS